MHRYLRAIGFSKIKKREQLQNLINEVVESNLKKSNTDVLLKDKNAVNKNKKNDGKENIEKKEYYNHIDFALDEDDRVFAELYLDFVHGAGICVRGEFDEDNRFLYEYYFPYLTGVNVSSTEDISIERQAEKESYAGVCDDIKVGVSLIFYLQNMIPYKRLNALKLLPVQGTSLILSAMSVSGTIMMPIIKNEYQKRRSKKATSDRNELIAQARMGNEEAIESLTLEDMDTYSTISRKIQKEDVFTLVDTYFMPYGVECDQYSVLGEITAVRIDKNRISDEEVVFMTVECNELTIEICINKEDLYGEPAVGRRFKGTIWLQGYIAYP